MATKCCCCSRPMRCIASMPRWPARNIREIALSRTELAFPLEELLDAITPTTRAVLIANPNNPTGTGIALAGHRAHSANAPRNAAVLIDEAYFEFCGVTALPLIRTSTRICSSAARFRKCIGMAAMRCGCLFSQRSNVRLSAQGAIALQRQHAGRAGGARRGARITEYVANVRGGSAGGARAAVRGPGEAGHPLLPELRRISCWFDAGERADPSARRAARRGHSGARPQLRNSRVRARHRRHARRRSRRFLAELERSGRSHDADLIWSSTWTACWWRSPNRIARPSSRTVEHFTGRESRAMPFRSTRTRAAGITIGRSRSRSCATSASRSRIDDVVDAFQAHLLRQRHAMA